MIYINFYFFYFFKLFSLKVIQNSNKKNKLIFAINLKQNKIKKYTK